MIVAVEEVWNKFLLSPLEIARYVDEFESPWVKAYFDVGNVVFYGYPQDWIRTLGPRIDQGAPQGFPIDRGKGTFAWKNLGEGDIDWPAVRQAFSDIGFAGYMTTELPSGDAAYLADVSPASRAGSPPRDPSDPGGGPMTPTPAPALRKKYADLTKIANDLGIINFDIVEGGGKLQLTGTASYQLAKDELWNAIKRHAGWEDELRRTSRSPTPTCTASTR